jgi:hypothetical protein
VTPSGETTVRSEKELSCSAGRCRTAFVLGSTGAHAELGELFAAAEHAYAPPSESV